MIPSHVNRVATTDLGKPKKLNEFFVTILQYRFQEGSSLNAAAINYNPLKAMKVMKMIEELGHRFPVSQ
jgi:hypothetical protein